MDRDIAPTPRLWRWELGRAGLPETLIDRYENDATAQLGLLFGAGGQVLLSTVLGYMTAFDITDDFRLMARSMTARESLAALTMVRVQIEHVESPQRDKMETWELSIPTINVNWKKMLSPV